MNRTALASLAALSIASAAPSAVAQASQASTNGWEPKVRHKTENVDGLDIFYRVAGDPQDPAIVLLHGFPTSSHMYRDLIPLLADDFYVIAPDFPGYGNSSMPQASEWDYTFANLADTTDAFLEQLGVDSYSLYLMDYGAPVGYRLATEHPERIESLIVQNGNAYVEGLSPFWDPIKAYWETGAQAERDALRPFLTLEGTIWQFETGARDVESISWDNYNHIQPLLDRPGNDEIQLDLFYDYRTNVDLYPEWQAYFRAEQPPTLVIWGKNDPIFPDDGAYPYLRDLQDIEFHLFNTGHFLLEEDVDEAARLITDFVYARR